MKKNQYMISIVTGIIVGAIVALMIGSTTAILAGIISAGAGAWLGSLQWSRAKGFAIDVADELGFAGEEMAHWASEKISRTGKTLKWLLLAMKRLVVVFVTDVNTRKTVLAGLTVCIIPILPTIFLFKLIFKPEITEITLYALILFVSLIPITINLWDVVFQIWKGRIKDGVNADVLIKVRRLNPQNSFSFDWFYQIMEDDRGAIIAIARMLWIRTGNALKIIVYPCVLALWGVVALANNKTGASALSAMTLSGLHLAIAHLAGGIDINNINFWLSLAIAIGAGVVLGKKVHAMREPVARPLPSIKFRDQVTLERP